MDPGAWIAHYQFGNGTIEQMTRGIVYYNQGTKVIVRLSVSLHTLRKVYSGPVSIIHQGDVPNWLIEFGQKLQVQFVPIPTKDWVKYPLVQKTRLWRFSPYNISVFIDADTLVLADPCPLFSALNGGFHDNGLRPLAPGFFVPRFCDWKSSGGRIRRRIEAWRPMAGDKLIDDAIKFGPAINTGVFGWRCDHQILRPWEELAQRGYALVQAGGPDAPMNRTLDEIACQILIAQHPVAIVDESWNRSITISQLPVQQTKIVHFHGGKHLLTNPDHPAATRHFCDLWRAQYQELAAVCPGVRAPQGDRNLNREHEALLKRIIFSASVSKSAEIAEAAPTTPPRMDAGHMNDQTISDITICCAADPGYALKLARHMALWMRTPGLREQQFFLFCLNERRKHSAYSFFAQWPNVRLISWKFDHAETVRELAFSSFIWGAIEHVTTPYFMKLDGDSTPTGPFIWPKNFRNFTITADSWHYSKVKKEPGSDGKPHWLNRLDDWWQGPPLFPKIEGNRYRHRRLRSYCWIERTEFTRRAAHYYGSRLPVPSHDTSQWYLATRLKEPMQEYPFRKFIVA